MFKSIQGYALIGLLVALLGSVTYVLVLRHDVTSKAQTISNLQARNAGLEAAITAVEATNRDRSETTKKMEEVKRHIHDANEAPTPDAIAAALDGLRKYQAGSSRAQVPDDMSGQPKGAP